MIGIRSFPTPDKSANQGEKKLNGVIIYKGEITSYIPPSFVTSKEKGYISNLLALIEKGSKKEWIKLKDDTTITITTL